MFIENIDQVRGGRSFCSLLSHKRATPPPPPYRLMNMPYKERQVIPSY